MFFSWCLEGKQRVVRRDSVVRVELAELSAELDLDILSRLGSLSRAFSNCPSQNSGPGPIQCQCAVDISLPLAYILLPSKQAFQSIYNSPYQSHHLYDEFQLCKSAFRLGKFFCSDGKNFILT
ncbi:hypothetical protein GOODEAATRI_008098 [Goodea atripinnis]|uniref:Uncharacterized protein n=1 Tax=Goodea atripinnis TaxID=208336 RepID=A0ABV0MZM9_9TELE